MLFSHSKTRHLPIAVLCVAVLLAGCRTTPENRWTYVTSDADATEFYVDLSSITVDGDHVEAWELADFEDDGSDWRSMKSLVHYKCESGLSVERRAEFFPGRMGKGRLVRTACQKCKDYSVPAAGTPSVELNQLVCSAAQNGPNNSSKPTPLRGAA